MPQSSLSPEAAVDRLVEIYDGSVQSLREALERYFETREAPLPGARRSFRQM